MNPSNRAIMSVAAITILSGCSSSDLSTPPESQTRSALGSAAAAPPMVQSTLIVPHAATVDFNAAKAALRDPNVQAELRALALHASSLAGVSFPSTMHVVAASDHQAAQSIISGAIINDHAPVYVIQMTGGPFTAIRHPHGVPAPQGEVLVLTIDAQTRRVTDVGYLPVAPDLTLIGSVVVDLRAQ